MGFRVALGRLLIASLIFVSAWIHLEKPDTFVDFYSKSYDLLFPLASQFGVSGLPSPAEMASQWLWIIKVVGIYELTSAILIVYGQSFGTVLALINKIVVIVFTHYPLITKGVSWAAENNVNLADIPLFIGIFFVLLAKYDSAEPSSSSDEQKKVSKEEKTQDKKPVNKGDKKKSK